MINELDSERMLEYSNANPSKFPIQKSDTNSIHGLEGISEFILTQSVSKSDLIWSQLISHFDNKFALLFSSEFICPPIVEIACTFLSHQLNIWRFDDKLGKTDKWQGHGWHQLSSRQRNEAKNLRDRKEGREKDREREKERERGRQCVCQLSN